MFFMPAISLIGLGIALIINPCSCDEQHTYVTVQAHQYDPSLYEYRKNQNPDDHSNHYYARANHSQRHIIDDRIYQYYAQSFPESDSPDYYAELATGQTERGLFPNIFNLASNAIISVNGTCGQRGPESFCKLVEHVYNRQPQCDICDDSNPQKRHPIEYAVDGTSRWWQSPSLATGLQYEWVTITLDLRQQYQVAYVVLKAAIAPRPGNWILERSMDGEVYTPWQYYAVNDEECERIYGIPATRGIPKYTRDDEVTCTSLYSRLDPLENGEIHTSLVNGRPGVDGPSEQLQNFTKARYVRFRFQRLRTLNSDLIYVTHGHIDQSVTRRYYYAIRDISIGGQCICYGHAEHCPVDPTTGQMKCECKHNTTGESCKECLPLYNQKPWRSGTSTNPNICEPCQCFNHATECRYDQDIEKQRLSLTPDGIYEGGGVCVDCQHNTQGVNCQECKLNYYRPAGVSPYSPDACRPCDCDPTGSLDGSCVKDETFARDGLKPGDCYCKPGFGGPRCDRCDIGYRNYPTCDPCPCNRAGSANYAYCGDTCVCKKNVEGTFCDRCKAGTFNLDEDNPDGCTPCFCFGMTNKCRELDWEKTQIRELRGWSLTDMEGRKSVSLAANISSDIALTLNVRETPDRSLFYWSAPKAYVGNLLTSYGGYLAYFVYYVAESSGATVPLPDVIIKGEYVSLEYYSRQEFRERENVSVRIRFHEDGSWYDSKTRRPVEKLQLMSALSSVNALMIRSTYHQHQLQASIYGMSLDSANRNGYGRERTSSVEQCECPATFTGLSCETCQDGYRRINNVLFNGKCELCVCHGHSDRCDPFSGSCLECQHNTTGARCEHCLQGYYGAPNLGGEAGACRQCGCPLTDPKNNFSPTCTAARLGVSAVDTDYVCTACSTGYMGNKCEMCADGYFGDPTQPGGGCQPCSCSGNIDPAAIGNCDRTSGKCLKCIGNTEGDKCERCKPQFYGDALRHDCRACGCNLYGSVSAVCNNRTGDCECKPNYVGIQCDRCKEGHGDIENGCPPCQCNVTGSHTDRCDALSGQCQCKPGVFGKRCDTCLTGYFGFSTSGCQFCGCYALGSIDNGKCESKTGQCMCRPHVTGQRCTSCEDGYFNISSGAGCQSCDCHAEGSEGNVCDQHTGQCRCKVGVTGLRCDKCAPNYYGLSRDGCKKCPVCPAAGHVCDPVTGQCVCPPYTVGDMCESCAEDTWNYHPLKGCEPCNCNSGGSAGPSCDRKTGACVCRDGYTGQKCDQCTHGHYGFPACRRCRCNEGGTDPRTCHAEMGCSCDDQGQCPCKKNVRGQKCRECSPSSFSLESNNPNGCTECFCFNRTNFCIQSSYVWQQINAPNRHAFFTQPWQYYENKHGMHVFPNEPPSLNSYPTDHKPIYWLLPGPFTGDKVTSYNGYLRFQVYNKNGNYLEGPARPEERYFEYYPMVVLIGNHRVIMEHYKPHSEISDSGIYVVKLREDHWKARHHKEVPVTRQMMMVALQNVQAIYIRGTFIERASEAGLSGISLDTAVWDNTTLAVISNNNTAIGVEACDCPTGYTGISCQNPADGYCRKKKANYLDSENDLDLVGSAEPCACNSHSRTCDRETCKCTNCEHNTTGDYCDYCAPGYYGDAREGTPNDCNKCACPLEENSFSATCHAVPLVAGGKGYVCDYCQQGYTGQFCESCIEGYYGDPTVAGGKCSPCNCNRDGSLSTTCDRTNGQCQCRSGVTGRDCSECRPRHALMGRECLSCDVGCTRDLMTDVDDLERLINSYNFTGLVPAPWGRLASIENRTLISEKRSQDIKKGETEARDMLKSLGDVKKPLIGAKQVIEDVNYIKTRLEKAEERMQQFPSESQELMADIQKAYAKTREVSHLFSRYNLAGGFTQRNPSEINRWVDQSTMLLAEMQNRTEYLEKRLNRADLELSRAKELLNEIVKRKFNDTTFELLGRRIVNITKNLEDARTIVWDSIRHRLNLVDNVTSIDKKMVAQYEEYLTRIKELNATAADLMHDAKDKLEGSKMHLLNIHDDYTESNFSLIRKIENVTIECEMLANQLANLLPEYQRDWVEPAQSYAALLESNAEMIKNSFTTTRNASQWAVKAAQAYQEIEGALHNSSKAASTAKETSGRTVQETTDRAIVANAEKSLARSTDLLREAAALDVNGLKESLKKQNISLGDIDEKLNLNKKEHIEATKRFDQFDTMNDRVQAATEQAKKILGQAQDADRKTKETVENIHDLNSKVQALVASTGKGISNITERVMHSFDNVKKARSDLEKVRIQAMENDEKVDELTRKLLLLKEKIAVARGKASQIKLSVKSKDDGICSRSYMSPAVPSPINRIHIEYKPTWDVRNSTIFLTQTEQSRTRQSEYMAVELRGQRIVFLWNVGGGDRMVTNLMRIDPIPEKSLKTWYHIDIERRGNSATLNVSLVPNGKAPSDVSKISYDGGGDSLIFNTIPGVTLINLGVPSSVTSGAGGSSRIARYRMPLEGSPLNFYGNVGDIRIDNSKLSLWNFVHDSGHCLASYAEVDEPDNGLSKSYLFDDGFAQLSASPYGYDSKTSNIQIVFATYSENGLIYFRGNPNDKDFVSIELSDGQIVFQFYLGGNSKLRLTSRESYNDGRFHTVVARRHLTNGSLSVNGDSDFVTELTPGILVDLNVRSAEHYVGGVPLSFNKSIWNQYNINWEGFYGCIVKLTPAQGEELDMSTAIQTLNVKPNCIQQNDRFVLSNRPISFAGDGLFVVNGLQLDPVSTVAFNFRTSAADGILLYQSSRLSTRRRRDTRGKGFYVIFLNGGRVHARIGQDSGSAPVALQSSSAHSFNDGRWHTVVLRRNYKDIALYVDDVLGQKSSLKGGDEPIVSRNGQLFMGGVGHSQYPSDELPNYHAYSGCISDVFLNYERVNLLPQKQDNAYLGQCNATLYQITATAHPPEEALPMDDTSTTTVAPTTTTPQPDIACIQSTYFSPIPAAALYGVTSESFNRFRLSQKFDTSDMSFWLEFRTDQANGVLLAWPNKNWRNYFLIQLENGIVVLRMMSSRMKMEASGSSDPNRNLADSRWHSISIIKKKRQISMEIDAQDNQIIKNVPEKPKLKMKGGLVIGGVPKRLNRNSNMTFTNFMGCIRNFSINNEIHKLIGEKGQRGVYPCYEPQPAGIYFPGNGFVRFDKGTEIGLSVVDLEFRSDNASDAVLMMATIPYAEAGYFSIELHNGQVRAVIKPPGNGVGGQESILESVSSKALCDNDWHRVRVEIIGLKFSLRVDEEATKIGSLSKEILSFLLNVPVYFGGLEQSEKNQDSLQLPTKSFKGCLRDVSINAVPVDWYASAVRKRAFINSCPLL